MYCTKCGAKAEPDASFCANCGTPLQRAQDAASSISNSQQRLPAPDLTGPLVLRKCSACGQEISVTALFCPACHETDEFIRNWTQTAKTAARWAFLTGLALVGPNAIVGALLGQGAKLNRLSAKDRKMLASAIGAIDSVPIDKDFTAFFTKTGFVSLFMHGTYDDSELPGLIPYSAFRGVHIDDRVDDRVAGRIEYETQNFVPPIRPKRRERLLLGKKLYQMMLDEADEFDKKGVPETQCHEFVIEGSSAPELARFVAIKFEEYANKLASK